MPNALTRNNAPNCLHGLRVLDLTQIIAGPYCGMQLAMLGAQVTKVEAFSGDPLRWRGGSAGTLAAMGLSTHYQAQAYGREVTYLDWETSEGSQQLLALIAEQDVFVCNLRAHVLPRCGLAVQSLREKFPKLVICTLSGYAGDACKDWPAYDNTIQAASGIMRTSSSAESGARVGAPIMDYACGMAALAAVLAALLERQRSGQGQHLAVNMLAVAHQLMSAQRMDYELTGNEPQHKGNRANSGEPLSQVFETARGHLALAVNEAHQFHKLAQVLGQDQWLQDARFATAHSRRNFADALVQEVQAVLRSASAQQWEQRLNSAGVAAAWVRTLAQSLKHPGAQAQSRLFDMERGQLELTQLAKPAPPPELGPAFQANTQEENV
jgi:CoA:oxalate CoA-transferase